MAYSNHNFSQSRMSDKYSNKRYKALDARDKNTALAKLIEDTKKDLKPSEFDYFETFLLAGKEWKGNYVLTLRYLDEAREVFKKYHHTYPYKYTTDNGSIIDKDFDSKYMEVINRMIVMHTLIGSMKEFLPILEIEQVFINTLSAKTRIDFYIELSTQYAIERKFEKAESSLSIAKSIMDSKVRLLQAEHYTDRHESEVRLRKENSYHSAKSIIMNSKKIVLEEQGQSTISIDSIIKRDNLEIKFEFDMGELDYLYKRFCGVTMNTILSLSYSPKRGIQPLPDVEPAGYFEKIKYYIRRNDPLKSKQIISKARVYLKEWEQRNFKCEDFRDSLNLLESILHFSQGKYEHLITTRSAPLNDLDTTLKDALPYLTEKELQSFFLKYQSSLNYYLAALSLTNDPADVIKLFEKSIVTRGLLLFVSRERSRIVNENLINNSDKTVVQIRRTSERVNLFAQKTQTSQIASDLDSLHFYESKLSNLQRDLNARLGISTNLYKSVSWKEIQYRLKPGDCFVFIQQLNREYFDPQYHEAIRVDPEYWFIFFDNYSLEPKLAKIGKTADLERGFRYYQNAINGTIEDHLSYDLFWKPISDAAGNNKKIYFSADGLYHLMNPYTLLNSKTQKYVLDETEVIRVSQLSSVMNQTLASLNDASPLAFIGNPDFSMNRRTEISRKVIKHEADFSISDNLTRSGLTQLPGAEQEVVEVSQQANKLGLNFTLLTGAKATEANVKRISNPEVLHFATHGVFESGSSYDAFLRSKLVLAGVNDGNTFTPDDHSKFEDGWLTAFEVAQMDLQNTKLVVLSACQTAVGDLKASDGVYGLQRAFEVAGAGYVMGSLWAINDQATATYMTEFYNSYLSNRNALVSYRTAMTATRKKFSHPNYWGSFILNGND
jgi:CHAT domain-containing protein